MIPVAPEISVRLVQTEESAALLALVNRAVSESIYRAELDDASLQTQVLALEPQTLFPVRWQRTCNLGAWRGGQLIGLICLAIGFDADSQHLPDYQPLGLLRFLILPEREDLIDVTARALLSAAEEFWQEAGIGFVKAFHVSTGFPSFQGGGGVLPGDWRAHFRLLTEHDYVLESRYYAFRRHLTDPVEEAIPLADLNLVYRGDRALRRYEIYRRSERIASAVRARFVVRREDQPLLAVNGIITELEVAPAWRGNDLGKLLLCRIINDSTVAGFNELLIFVSLNQNAAMNLVSQQGFEELNYRGYVLEKVLRN